MNGSDGIAAQDTKRQERRYEHTTTVRIVGVAATVRTD